MRIKFDMVQNRMNFNQYSIICVYAEQQDEIRKKRKKIS